MIDLFDLTLDIRNYCDESLLMAICFIKNGQPEQES
jgi:hypothetical protein